MITPQAISGITPSATFCSFPTTASFVSPERFSSLSAINMMFGNRLAAIAFVLATPSLEISRRNFLGAARSGVLFPFFVSGFSSAPRPMPLKTETSNTRIGIVGGGIAGVTAAHSLAKRLADEDVSIVVMEGDSTEPCQSVARGMSPQWVAATARNANSLVPGAAMHLMSQKDTIFQIMTDTIREGKDVCVESIQNQFATLPRLLLGSTAPEARTLNIDNFDTQPPYFALHLLRCLGISATVEERISFLRFIRHFLSVSLFGEAGAQERAACLVQLAKANRAAVLEEIADANLQSNVGLSQGFLSLHRTHAKAVMTVEECLEYGEEAKHLSWQEATLVEPRLKRLPVTPLFAVHRTHDNTASCEVFVKHLIDKCASMGVEYRRDKVAQLEVLKGKDDKSVFRVSSADGSTQDFDVLILATGIQTPLMAAKLGAGAACPTYPLRGYSLTFFTPAGDGSIGGNLLNQPFSVDSMYCSSVNPRMARFAGFGELVGYPDKAVHIPSVGPRVLARYASQVCPEAMVSEDDALQCFRPISPDDVPLAGEVSAMPGLFLHTGHGTLGWTLSLATAECVAQAVADRLGSNESTLTTFTLPDNTSLERKTLSPDRFA
jgi:glycine/D-amino acid oxidase-like deaminating enzyme